VHDKPSFNMAAAPLAITGSFWLLRGGRFPRSTGSHRDALRFAIALLLALLAFSLNAPSASYAATLTVCASGCGYTTIAAAIAAASPSDTVSILDAVHTEANIAVDRNLTIQGQGAANTAVDGGGGGGVFVIDGGVTATIQDMTIRNGSAGSGGGIYNGGTVTISNSTLSGNSASGGGGAIFSYGTVTISGSTLSATPLHRMAAASGT
jgi:predicted outer membrane repeat protein